MLFPPSTNDAYAGPPAAVVFLGLLSLLTIGPGLLHVLLPDGGAGVIAGLDLSRMDQPSSGCSPGRGRHSLFGG